MNDFQSLPDELRAALTAENERILQAYSDLRRRDCALGLLPPAEEPAALAIICLADWGELLQVAGKAVPLATVCWATTVGWGRTSTRDDKAHAVHDTRHHLDHAVVTLSAASNHLASAMWHVGESAGEP